MADMTQRQKYDLKRKSVELTKENLAAYDAVLISTNHSVYDIAFIAEHAQLILDTRNMTAELTAYAEKIVKA